MISTRRETVFFLLAALVGGLLLRSVFLAEQPLAKIVPRFIEAQDLAISATSDYTSSGFQDTSSIASGQYVGENFIWFPSRTEGDEVVFEISGFDPGDYHVYLHMAYGGDFGIVDIRFNGELVAEGVDLATAAQSDRQPIALYPVALLDVNTLGFTVTGTNPATSFPHYQLGLDGLQITP